MHTNHRTPLTGLLAVSAVGLWSVIDPRDMLTWFLEASPVLLAVPLLFATYRTFRLTDLVYILLTLHAILLLVGAHYTYAEVPLFHTISNALGYERNYYDRLGHIFQGAVPAILIRELLLRTSPLKPGKWLFTIIVFACFGISAIYEVIEWWVAYVAEAGSIAFLGTQGDVWDTQKDMLMAGIGAAISLLIFAKIHNRQLANLSQ